MENKTYKKLSSLIYNHTKPPGFSIDNDIQFYKKYIIPINNKVLELGSGNGRFLIPFLRYKINIEGVEKSDDMNYYMNLNLKKFNLKTRIYESDFINAKFETKYELIVAPNGWLNLIPQTEINLVFNKIFNTLCADGRFIFDLIYPKNFKDSYQNISIENNNYEIFIKNILNNEFMINNEIIFKCNNIIEKENFIIYRHSIVNDNSINEKFNFENVIINFDNDNNRSEMITKTFILSRK